MSNQPLYPLLLAPSLHVLVWGGRKLQTRLGIPLPTTEPYGEAWTLHDSATIANGSLAGRTVGELVAEYGTDLIGTGNPPADGMPLLIKFLDANDWLSVQVHPNDVQAKELEGQPRGKTEAWVVIDTEPGAKLINGVLPGTTKEALADAIRDEHVRDLLSFVEVHPGDALFQRAGTIHALGPGILIYEVQQSSNTTYRLYDWGRMGLDGKPRLLHIDKGTAVSDMSLRSAVTKTPDAPSATVFDSSFFMTIRHHLTGEKIEVATEGRFHAITVIDGAVTIHSASGSVDVALGQTALIPAVIDQFSLSGTGIALRSYQPAPQP